MSYLNNSPAFRGTPASGPVPNTAYTKCCTPASVGMIGGGKRNNAKTIVVPVVIREVVVARVATQIIGLIVPGAAAQGGAHTGWPFSLYIISFCMQDFYPAPQHFPQFIHLAATEFIGFNIDETHIIA